MARDTQSLKIKKWADAGDRTNPDDPILSPPLDRMIGWPDSFSQIGGNTPRRTVFNQLFREITGMLDEINRKGILEYDAGIVYEQGAVIRVGNRLMQAVTELGEGTTAGVVSPADVGQSSWIEIPTPLPIASSNVIPNPGELGVAANTAQLRQAYITLLLDIQSEEQSRITGDQTNAAAVAAINHRTRRVKIYEKLAGSLSNVTGGESLISPYTFSQFDEVIFILGGGAQSSGGSAIYPAELLIINFQPIVGHGHHTDHGSFRQWNIDSDTTFHEDGSEEGLDTPLRIYGKNY